MTAGFRFAQHGRRRVCTALDLIAGQTVLENSLEGSRHFPSGFEVYEGEVASIKPCAGVVGDGEIFSATHCQSNRTASRGTVDV